MSFEDYVAQTKPRLDAAFADCLERLFDDAAADLTGLLGLPGGGKKIRGCLLCLVSDSLGGAAGSAVSRAVAVELVHSASLIHDDFVDQDVSRHARPAVWTLAGARRAVLLGDVIFATAIRMMSELGAEDGRVIADAIARVSMGAFREPLDARELGALIECQASGVPVYEKIIGLKTGVLFAAACELGALAAGADTGVRARLREYGLRIGEAYQIADDAGDLAQQLRSGPLPPAQAAALAPALLYFAPESRGSVERSLARRGRIDAGFAECLSRAAEAMEREIGRRIDAAIEQLDGLLLRPGLREVVLEAPRELIRMFRRAH